MIKLKKNLYLIIFFLLLTNCQSVKDGLTGKKSSNTDEFLIKKKNPLTLPPEFNGLPKPSNEESELVEDDKFNIKKIIDIKTSKVKIELEEEEGDSLESLILKKINKK